MGPALAVEPRTFMLRPRPAAAVPFRGTYREEGWRRCGQMSTADGIRFTPWPHASLPAWSLPAHEAAKCAARQGEETFSRVHLRLYEAFFTESRDIADRDALTRIVSEVEGVDVARFQVDFAAGAGREIAVAEHEAAVGAGVQAIPAVIVEATGHRLVGLAETATYRQAIAEAGAAPAR
jgi:predicted DsbA family dithiol-disulfide isomerase